MIPHIHTLFEFISIPYENQHQTLNIKKIDRGQIRFRDYWITLLQPGVWLAETFSTSHLKPLNRIQGNLRGSKILMSSTKFVFFGPNGKTRWPPWPFIGWDIFDLSSETAEWNPTTLDRKQDLNVLYQVCVFGADRKNKMAALASDWLRHFQLLLWNRWMDFNATWQ